MQDIFNNANFDTTMNDIASAEASIANLRGENKARTMENNANTQQMNAHKIDQYVSLIVAISPVDLVGSGKNKRLPSTVSKQLTEELGTYIKPATAKKLKENSVKARHKLDIGGDNVTPEMVRAVFADHEIDSEKKLMDAVDGDAGKSEMWKMAEKLFGKETVTGSFKASKYDAMDWAEFDDACRELKAARLASDEAAAKAKAEAASENETVDKVLGALDAA
jgi:hypothetical protein